MPRWVPGSWFFAEVRCRRTPVILASDDGCPIAVAAVCGCLEHISPSVEIVHEPCHC